MNINLVLFLAILLAGYLTSFVRNRQRGMGLFIGIIITLLILESCLRSLSVGPDTKAYYNAFQDASMMDWTEIGEAFVESYVDGEGKDPGYLVFQKICLSITDNFNLYLFFTDLIFFIPLALLLKRFLHSHMQLVFAFTLYVTLFSIIALSGIRQQITIGLSMMAFLCFADRKYIPAILLLLFGATIHISLLIFLLVPVFGLLLQRWLKPLHVASFLTIPVTLRYAGPLMLFVASFMANDYYSDYGFSSSVSSASTYIFMMELLSLFCLFGIPRRQISQKNDSSWLYAMLPLITMTVPLISLDGAMIRIGEYFTLYMLFLVPMSIENIFQKRFRWMVYVFLTGVLILMGLRAGGLSYTFFWQVGETI